VPEYLADITLDLAPGDVICFGSLGNESPGRKTRQVDIVLRSFARARKLKAEVLIVAEIDCAPDGR